MHEYLAADIICCKQRTVFRELSSKKTVSLAGQIIRELLSRQMETIVLLSFKMFFVMANNLIAKYESKTLKLKPLHIHFENPNKKRPSFCQQPHIARLLIIYDRTIGE